MKKLALIVLTFALVFGVSTGVLVLADTSNPGQPMYVLDRYMESLSLNASKMMGNRAYGNLNLRLASERLSEVKFVTGNKNVTSLVFKTYAQTDNGTDNEVVKQLIKDFNQNIKEVINAFNNETGDQKDIVLANEIAIKTTEFSNQLVDILADVDAEVETELVETSTILEDLDDDAVEALVDDSSNEDESENRSLSIEKVTKTILKASEKLVETKKDLEEKRREKKISETDAVLIASELERVGVQIETAKIALTNGEVKDAYTNAKLAKEAVSSLRDRIDALEVRDEVSREDESEVEIENEDESKTEVDKDEDKKDDKKDDKKTTTKDDKKEDDRTKSNSGKEDDEDKSENSGRDEPEKEEEVEVEDENDSDDDEDVKGAQDSATSSLWLDLIF